MNKQTRVFEKRLRQRRKKNNKRKAYAAKRLSVVKKIKKIKNAMKHGRSNNKNSN